MHGEKPEPVELRRIMMRELRLIGSCTYSWNDIEVASRLVSSGAFTRSFHAVVTSMVGLGEVNGAMKELELKRQLKVLVDVRRPLA
jgi:threonine dehydrogenase-like Zn-dependent dehydrogenase